MVVMMPAQKKENHTHAKCVKAYMVVMLYASTGRGHRTHIYSMYTCSLPCSESHVGISYFYYILTYRICLCFVVVLFFWVLIVHVYALFFFWLCGMHAAPIIANIVFCARRAAKQVYRKQHHSTKAQVWLSSWKECCYI